MPQKCEISQAYSTKTNKIFEEKKKSSITLIARNICKCRFFFGQFLPSSSYREIALCKQNLSTFHTTKFHDIAKFRNLFSAKIKKFRKKKYQKPYSIFVNNILCIF